MVRIIQIFVRYFGECMDNVLQLSGAEKYFGLALQIWVAPDGEEIAVI